MNNERKGDLKELISDLDRMRLRVVNDTLF